MEDLIRRVNTNISGIFKREPELIATLEKRISEVIGDNSVFLSEFVLAKIKGKIMGHNGHPEVTDPIFKKIPETLSYQMKILEDTRHDRKFLFVGDIPLYEIVVEVSRLESGKTEINTVHVIDAGELKRLEHKFPVLLVLARPQ